MIKSTGSSICGDWYYYWLHRQVSIDLFLSLTNSFRYFLEFWRWYNDNRSYFIIIYKSGNGNQFQILHRMIWNFNHWIMIMIMITRKTTATIIDLWRDLQLHTYIHCIIWDIWRLWKSANCENHSTFQDLRGNIQLHSQFRNSSNCVHCSAAFHGLFVACFLFVSLPLIRRTLYDIRHHEFSNLKQNMHPYFIINKCPVLNLLTFPL